MEKNENEISENIENKESNIIDSINETETEIINQNNFSLFNIFSFFSETFIGDAFYNISDKTVIYSKFILVKPYEYITNGQVNKVYVDWIDKNIFNNLEVDIINSIKVLSISTILIIFYLLFLNINLLIRTYNVMKLNYNIDDIRIILAEQERTLNNIAKIGFNYVVENNCSMIT